MANPKQAVNSLLTEHFRYTPLTLIDDIINTVNELVYRAVTAVEEGLSSADPAELGWTDPPTAQESETDVEGHTTHPPSRVEIENGVHQLETLLQATVDRNFDKLEIFVLRNILSVDEDLAPWMRLGHYENLNLQPTNPTHPHPTPNSLLHLRRQLTETRKLHASLLAERASNEAFIIRLRTLLFSTLSFIPSAPGAKELGINFTPSADTPLTTHTEAALAQLPALKRLLGSLREKSAEGALVNARRNVAGEERREYIESQIRRKFEREGKDLASGDGLGGRDAGGGRRVGVEEVRAIEGVVGVLRHKSRTEE